MQIGKLTSVLILTLVILFLCAYWYVGAQCKSDSQASKAKRALLSALGISSLAISSDCTSVRNITEGIAGCLGDVPGGYCYHSSCDTMAPNQVAYRTFKLTIEKNRKVAK